MPAIYRGSNTASAHSLTRQRQLAAHLKRLPPERSRRVISGQEDCGLAQWRRASLTQRIAARPKQRHVQEGGANGPNNEHRKRRVTHPVILLRVTIDFQVGAHVATHAAAVDIKWHTKKCPEDACRSTRNDNKSEA
eukprot:6002852-Prymnesium_polylepis.4